MTDPTVTLTPQQVFMRLVSQKIYTLSGDSSTARATRAAFRRYNGTPLVNHPNLWAFLYENTNDEQLSALNLPKMEQALAITLGLFANQHRLSTRGGGSATAGEDSLPVSLQKAKLSQHNSSAWDKKVTGLFSAGTTFALQKRLISLARVGKFTGLNYPKLAWDLYQLQTSKKNTVIRNWGRTYWRTSPAAPPANTTPQN